MEQEDLSEELTFLLHTEWPEVPVTHKFQENISGRGKSNCKNLQDRKGLVGQGVGRRTVWPDIYKEGDKEEMSLESGRNQVMWGPGGLIKSFMR